MLIIVGAIIALICTLGGYVALGGHLEVLWQPFEVVIICGTGFGAYVIANPKSVLTKTASAIGQAVKGNKLKKESYLELLSLLFQIFKLAKSKGMLALEQHVDNPSESPLFQQFPGVLANKHAMEFLCDYLRLMSLNAEDPHTMETLMDEEIETHHHEASQIASAIQTAADSMPALGIVAAVLGIIKTMGSITEPPEVLGHLIGGALVGTFLGVWLSYAFVAPIASSLKQLYDAEAKYFDCIKAGLAGLSPRLSAGRFGRIRPQDADAPCPAEFL